MIKLPFAKSFISATLALSIILTPMTLVRAEDVSDAPEVIAGGYADWQVVGPTGGDVRAIAIDPKNKNRLYISTLDGQIHTSADGGRSWNLLVNLNKPELILDQLMVDRSNSQNIFVSGHRHKTSGGFFRSTDGGANWKESKDLKNAPIHAMTQSANDPKLLYAGTPQGVWMSKNSGEDWEKISSPSMPVNIDALATDPRNTSTMYAGTWWRAYKTIDAGKSWRLIRDGMIDDSDVFAVIVDPQNPEHIIASACRGIYESMSGGERWARVEGMPAESGRTRDIVQHPSVPSTIYVATTEGFWMSVNSGKSWALTTQRNLEINSIAVHPDEPNRVFIATNNHGVMVSNDGGRNFTTTNDNFTSRLTYSVTPDTQQPNRLYAATHNTASGGGFFFISPDGGRTWQPARNLDFGRVRVFTVKQDPIDPNTMFLGTNLGIFRSIDRGNSWTHMIAPKPQAPVKKAVAKKAVKGKKAVPAKTVPAKTVPVATGPTLVPTINEKVKVLEFLPNNGGMLAGTDNGIYRSTDLTKGWEKLAIDPSFNSNVFAIHVTPTRPDTIWAGTATTGVIVSHDGGKTWARTGGAVDNIPVSSIASDPKRPDYIYVGTTQAFYRSRNNGRDWDRRGGGLSLGNFTSILINPNNTDEILISSSLDTDGGIFISTDAGNRWKRVDTEKMRLPSRRVWAMAFDPTDPDRIFAATHSSGVYKIERSARTAAGM